VEYSRYQSITSIGRRKISTNQICLLCFDNFLCLFNVNVSVITSLLSLLSASLVHHVWRLLLWSSSGLWCRSFFGFSMVLALLLLLLIWSFLVYCLRCMLILWSIPGNCVLSGLSVVVISGK